MRTRKIIRIAHSKRKMSEKLVVWCFGKILNVWITRILGLLSEHRVITNEQLHNIDAVFKGYLQRPGFKHLTDPE